MKKIGFWAVIVFIGFYLFSQPHAAHEVISSLIATLKAAGGMLTGFLRSL